MTHLCALLFGKDCQTTRRVVGAVVGIFLTVKIGRFVSRVVQRRKTETLIQSLPRDKLHLFVFPRWSRGPSFSVPCFRLEAFLRLSRVPYTTHFVMDTSLSPTERLPMIAFNGLRIADSEFIAQWVKKHYQVDVDAHLTPQQHAVGLATRRLTESTLQQASYRASMVDNKEHVIDIYSKEFGIPTMLARYFVNSMRKGTIQLLNIVGHGDWNDEQYKSEMLRDYKALEALIADKPFLLGDKPTSYDCCVFANLQTFMQFGIKTPEFEYLRNSKILSGYVARLEALLFPDLAAITSDRKVKSQDFPSPIY